ncbi:hypothetical protein Trydic_g8831 [Trypoxylus dichotomus]
MEGKRICSYCTKHFKTLTALTRHERTHVNIEPKICRLCPEEVFHTSNEYRIHINEIHHGKDSPNFICSKCGKQFKNKNELNNHVNSECGTVKLYKCQVCNQKLMSAGSLYNHMLRHKGQLKVHERIHTQEKAFVCDICGKGFCHRQSLITHSTLHTGIKPYSCENCGHSFSCVGNLLKHRKTHVECGQIISTSHRVTNPFTKMKVKPLHQFTIKNVNIHHEKLSDVYESNNFYNKANSARKERSEIQINTEKENISHKNTSKQYNGGETQSQKISEWNTEEKEEINENRSLESEEESFSPTNIKCKKTKENNVVAQKNQTFKCSYCQETFNNKNDYEIHQIHVCLLTCQECDKVFPSPDLLRSHKNSFHNGIGKKTYTYICDRCGKQFRQKSALIRHNQNKCTDGPQIKCTICNKNFSSVYVRKYHMRIHSTEKKLLCKFCGKSFHWKGQLKIHERRHTGEKPFTCLYCPKAFAYRESLITHSSLHTGIKPHLCEACGSRFSCIGNLIKHKTTHASTCGIRSRTITFLPFREHLYDSHSRSIAPTRESG